MYLVEILLPITDNAGRRFGDALFAEVREALVEKFGGLTAFTRSPAEGLWQDGGGTDRDEIVVLEVMTDAIDRDWWRAYRTTLEQRFHQDEIVVRAREMERL